MIKITPNDEQLRFVDEFLKKGSIANRGCFDGSFLQQRFGLTAQIVVGDLLGCDRPVNLGVFDGGYDFIWMNKRFDVKCEIRSVNFNKKVFVHNLMGKQVNYDVDGYIFVSYNRVDGVYEVCGWILKEDFLKNANFFSEGTKRIRSDGSALIVKSPGGNYEIQDRFLNEVI